MKRYSEKYKMLAQDVESGIDVDSLWRRVYASALRDGMALKVQEAAQKQAQQDIDNWFARFMEESE